MALVLRRFLALGVLVLAVGVPSARAIPLGATVLVDRPGGSAVLPFDGIANSATAPRGLTSDGHFAVFSSQSNALLSGDEDTATNVYRVDLTTGALVQVDTTATGGQPSPGSDSTNASISADGNYVGFMTTSPTLAAGAGPSTPEFVVKNLTTGAVELASRSTGANGAPVAGLRSAVLSGDGRHVAFVAQSAVQAANATGVTTTPDAYVRDLGANTTRMVSVTDPAGTEGGHVFSDADIDFAGDAVAFVTSAQLGTGDTDTNTDAYVRTGIGGTEHTVLVSFSAAQTGGADGASAVGIANGPAAGQLQFGWANNGRIWWAYCVNATTCNTPAAQADHPRTNGNDNLGNEDPFFPPQPNATTFPTRIYWNARDGLDPADTNNTADTYGWDIGNATFNTSIHLMTGGDAGDGAFGTAATNDGAVTAFSSLGPNLPGSDGLVEQAYVRRAGADTNISQPLGQPPRNDTAGYAFLGGPHTVSDSGRTVAFVSNATAFGAPVGPEGPAAQVLVRDIVAGTTQLASAATGTQIGANNESASPSLDAAGDRVVFESSATDLVPGDGNKADDVFLHDFRTGATTLVDRTAGGGVPTEGAEAPQISADGTKAVFLSRSADIPGAPPDGKKHVYEIDLATGEVTLIDKTSAGAVANNDASQADIDGDGRRVAFISTASNLGGGTSGSLYLRDLTDPAAPTTTWISTPQDGVATHDAAFSPAIDRDGGRIAFSERNTAFGFGMTGSQQVFIRDVAAQTTTLASTGASAPANVFAAGPSISADGTKVAFTSNASSLPSSAPGFDEVYVRDLTRRTTVLGSARNGGAGPGRFGSNFGALSGNGACMAFASSSDDLVSGGYGSDFEHIFLHALSAACPSAASPPTDRTAPTISRFRVTHKRFAVGARPTALNAVVHKRHRPKPKVLGTTFTFTLSEAARVQIAITQTVRGHRVSPKKPCQAAHRRRKLNCTFTRTLLTLVRAQLRQGANRVAFSGRYRHTRLAKGTYTATITATDPAGNRSTPRRLTFTVVG